MDLVSFIEIFRPGNIIVRIIASVESLIGHQPRAGFAEDDFCSIEHGAWGNFNHHKENFLEGYSSIRKIPNYHQLMPLLQLNRAMAVIGFTVKRNTWDTSDSKLYQSHKTFVGEFFKSLT